MKIKIGDIPEWVRETVCLDNHLCRVCPFYSKEKAETNYYGGGCRKYDYDYADDEVEIADEFFREGENDD